MHEESGWVLVAARYAATGRADVTLQSMAVAAGVGLVQVSPDGAVTWSDEAYHLHGRPRWRRVRNADDALVGVGGTDARALRTAYALLRVGAGGDEVSYAVTPELGDARPVVLRPLGPGLALVHRAERATPDGEDAGPRERDHLAVAAVPAAEPVGPDITDPNVDLATAVLAVSPDLVVVYDLTHEEVVQAAGSTPDADEILAHLRSGDLVREQVHPEDRASLLAWRRSLGSISPDDVASTEARFRVDGQWRWREIRALDFTRDHDGHQVVLHIRDVHDRVEAVLGLTARERAFREVFDSSPVGLAVLDADGRIRSVNDAFCRLVGRTQDAVTATSLEALLHPEDRGGRTRTRLETGVTTATELRLVRSDGAVMWVRMRSSDISTEEGERVLVSVEDVTSAKAHEDQLRYDALHDDLTGLPNRRLIEDRLQRALARSRRTDTRLAVYFIDLDDLKRVNDTHPWRHRAGDVLITSVADALRLSLRDVDTLGRLGGDEFVAIVEDVTDDAMIDEIGERLLAAARQPLTIGDEAVVPGASVGVATPESDDETTAALLSRADAAMYRAKRAGGGQLVSADSLPALAIDLAAALQEGRLRLDYRPVVSLATGTLLGVESRIRWLGDGPADPDEVRAALEAGAAPPVVGWAAARAVSDVRTVAPTRTDHLSVWLPLPSRTALATSTTEAFAAAFSGPWGELDAGSAPSIVVDVHEDELATVVRRGGLHRHLEALVAVGPVALGVDRFSADAVPLGLLRSVTVASLTIDPALLAGAAENDADRDLLRSLVAAASAMGVVTVADEVDSPEDLGLARALGVHAVKGDLVGPFAPLETYSDLLHAGLVPLPDSFDARTHDELTGEPRDVPAAPPSRDRADEPTGETSEAVESELLSQDVLAAIRWLDELDRTATERGAVPDSAPDPVMDDASPSVDAARSARALEVSDPVPSLAPLAPASPTTRMPGLDPVDRGPDGPPPPLPWAMAAGAPDSTTVPTQPDPPMDAPIPARDEAPTAAPAEAPTAAPAAEGAATDDLVIELRDRPADIGAALAAELGVDLTQFDHVPAGGGWGADPDVSSAAAEAGAASASAPTPVSPFAGMALPPSPFLVLRPDPSAPDSGA